MKEQLIQTQVFKPKPFTLTEGKTSGGGNPIVEGILATVEIENGNGRFYSRELWEREIKKYETLVKENRAVGELDHPESQVVNLKNVSHNIKKIWWDNNNICGHIEILPTPSGNILKALIENNIMVGVSSRGMGSLEQVGEIMEVQDDFELVAWDFVSTPSNPGSWMKPLKNSLNESILKSYNKYQKIDNIIRDILNK
jgi:hypothetical protein